MKLKCPRKTCGYEWDYKGKSKYKATCPICTTSVMVHR